MCGYRVEDTLHTLRNCSWARAVWQLLVQQGDRHRFFMVQNPLKWVEANMTSSWRPRSQQEKWRYIFREAVSSIWYWRNQKIQECVRQTPPPTRIRDDILCRVNKLLVAYSSVNDVGDSDVNM